MAFFTKQIHESPKTHNSYGTTKSLVKKHSREKKAERDRDRETEQR